MSKLNKHTFYPLGDYYPIPDYRAKWTGEFRAPKKGEWYLSGSIIEAYRAFNDLKMEFHIAKIVRVRKVEYWEEVPDGS